MGRLQDWWRSLTGKAQAPAQAPAQASRRVPEASRPRKPATGFELVDEVPRPGPSRVGEAGFDPYASDAGYAKPHSWERVDHD